MDQKNGTSTDRSVTNDVRSALYYVIYQIVLGVAALCFLDALYLRFIEKEVLGIIIVRLVLLHRTLAISVNTFLMNYSDITTRYNWSQAVNIIWIAVPFVSIFSSVVCAIWLGHWNLLTLPAEKYVQEYQLAVKIIGVGFVVESFAIPAYILSRPATQDQAMSIRNVLAFAIRRGIIVLAVHCFAEHTISAYAYGNLTLAIISFFIHWTVFLYELRSPLGKHETIVHYSHGRRFKLIEPPIRSAADLLPKHLFSSSEPFLDTQLAKEILQKFKKVAIAQIFKDGELYAMTVFPALSFAEQGVYSTVNCLGRRIVRSIFVPLRNYTARFSIKIIPRESDKTKGKFELKPDVLFKFHRVAALLGLSILTFGLSYSHLISLIYGGTVLADWPGTLLMKAQCLIILLQGIRAVTAAYRPYVMSSVERKICPDPLNFWLSLLISGFLKESGDQQRPSNQLVTLSEAYYSDSSLSIVSNWCSTSRTENPASAVFPSEGQQYTFATVLAVTLWSEWLIYPYSVALHLVLGTICANFVLKAVIVELGGWHRVSAHLHEVFVRDKGSSLMKYIFSTVQIAYNVMFKKRNVKIIVGFHGGEREYFSKSN